MPFAEKANEVIRIGICGLGRTWVSRIEKELAPLPQFKVVAGLDVLPDRAVAMAAKYDATGYTDYREFLSDRAIQLVVIATRSHEHATMSIDALRAGKHVLVEKPIGITLAESDALYAVAAKAYPARLFVRQNRRFDLPFVHLMDILRSGLLGKVFSVRLRQSTFQLRNDWQTLREFGGGQLLNWGPHMIDWALQMANSRPVEVWSDMKQIVSAGDAEDFVKLLIRTDNGTTIDIETSSCSAVPQSEWMAFGSSGAAIISGETIRLSYYKNLPARVEVDYGTPVAGKKSFTPLPPVTEEIVNVAPRHVPNFWLDLHHAITTGDEFSVTLEQARDVMRVVDAVQRGLSRVVE